MKYILKDSYVIGYTNSISEFYFDLDDYEKVKYYGSWRIDKQGYVRTEFRVNGKRKHIKLHNLVMGIIPTRNKIVDHISRNKRDNRKRNLRIVTKQQNALNSKIQSNNTSGIRGVHFHKASKKWQVYIKNNAKRINIGLFENFEDAVCERLKAEVKLFGIEFSPQKHLFKDYDIT